MEPVFQISRINCIPTRSARRGPLPACLLAGLIALSACGRPMVGEEEQTACRIQLLDVAVNKDSLLQLREIGDEHYIGTEGLDTVVPLSVEVRVLAGDRLDVDRQLVQQTFAQIKKQYVMINDQQRTFVSVKDHACSEVEPWFGIENIR